MKIITHPQSRAYDEGWDAIFGKKAAPDQDDSSPESDTPSETGQVAPEDGDPLGNNPVQEPPASEQPVATPEPSLANIDAATAGVRRPRGWTPKNG